MEVEEFRCKYCDKKISKIEYDLGNGFCDKCRKVVEWKETLANIKEFEK